MDLKFKISDLKFLVLICVFSFPAFSIEPNDVNVPKTAAGILRHDAKTFPQVVLDDAKKTYFDKNNLMLLLMAGGGSIALHYNGDDKIAEHFDKHRSTPKDLDNITDWTGSPATHFAATGIWYLMAARNKDDLNIQRSWVMMRALTVTGATTLLLKSTVQNHTPNGHDWAWPSGHTSSSFTVAAVLDEFYGPKIGIPAYLAAGFVGYRMMDSGDHWASDVLFGGVLGYIVGHAIAGENKELQLGGFRIQPLVSTLRDSPATGIALAKEF
jgi:membrane-associated phospholipid phosphatase